MKALKLLAVGVAFCLAGTSAAADEKKADNTKLAVGKWDVTTTHEGGPPKGGTVEFTKDGKIKVSSDQGGMNPAFDGTYKIDGAKLVLTFKIGGKDEAVDLTIDKLDDKTFATTSKHGKVELTRKK
jgi:uncharacterized protein (TIGR03066 family)